MESKIEALIVPTLISMGYSVVRIKLLQGGQKNTLQIMAEHTDGSGITLDECAKISGAVSALLDVEDPISSEYVLEVSSPGMDRPLVKMGDFKSYSGKNARITTFSPIDGQRKFQGVLSGAEDNTITIEISEGNQGRKVEIPFENIASANLIVTADSLREILNKQ